MKKLLSHGLALAALLSLSTPALAAAPEDCGCPRITPATCGCGCPKVKPAVKKQEVVIGHMCPCPKDITQGLPQLEVSRNAGLELHVLNPQPYAVRFNSSSLGISHMIPANSERVINVDSSMTACLPAGQQVAYHISSPNGCDNLAYSCFQVDGFSRRPVAIYQEPVITPSVRTPVRSRSTIRGFW